MSTRLITLRGGRQIHRWVFVLGGVLIALSVVLLVGHQNASIDIAAVVGLLVGVCVLWLGSKKRQQ